MKQKEYLDQLEKRLERYPQSFRNDILDEFSRHFKEGIANGKTSDDIIEELGSVDEVMENIRMMNGDFQDNRNNDLQDTITQIGNTIRDTVFTVTDTISESVNQAHRNNTSSPMQSGIEPFTSLKINGDMDVRVIHADSFSYTFTPTRSLFSIRKPVFDAVVRGTQAIFALLEGHGNLVITIPTDLDSVDIFVMSGNVEYADVNTDQLKIDATSGDVRVENAAGSEAKLSTRSGDLEIRTLSFDMIQAEAASGDILITQSGEMIQASSTSGDVEIRDCTAMAISVKTSSGDAEISCHSATAEVSTVSGDIDIRTDEPVNSLICSSKSGDIDCCIYDADYTATLKSVSGSLRNKTRLPSGPKRGHEMTVGDGNGEVVLSSVSGDIKLRS